ncbi:hypothetical protein PR202_ga04677 [Eleusine coracana subsp. coracana]|uniref:NB-ARC domain-containing protein n=1 Tax=Eleusine coracana subsp. coracana TaxID=191504 RepID=A0AAV5BTK6_ELECO|nr:hypothetical protein PR202_ga04677 [Eleusine coracana subsp. coracana]
MPAAAPWPVSQDLPGLAGRAHALSLSAGADLGDLADALLRIEPVARELELRPGGHEAPALLAWLVELKGAVADAEDILDELHIRQCRQPGPASLSACVGAAFPNLQARKVRGLVGRLDRVCEGSAHLRGGLGRVAVECGVRSPNRVTGSFLVDRRVVGRQKECDEVVNRLIGGLSEEKCSSSAPVVALIGHGGMGKTTVAQCVYNDVRIEGHFDLRAWVCVWDRSDEAELTREILQSISGADETLCDDGLASLERLQERLEESVASKRFLLVLDDVWVDEGKTEQENRAVWSRVLAPLRFAGSGSKVLVTTRVKLVAEVLNATSVVPLDGLRSCDCWLLLKEAAFGVETVDFPPYLQEIGRAISAKLKGLPLAAKALGQMLKNTTSLQKWREVLNTEICDNIIISSLQLNYQHLPGHLQRCFAYCSTFPRTWRFNRYLLVHMWIALGFIQPPVEEGKRLEDLGQEYFDALLSRSFFKTTNKDQPTYYILDDLMYDLARHFSAHDCLRVEDEIPVVIQHMVHHVSVSTDYLPQFKSTYRLGRLRTLVVHRSSALSSGRFPCKFLARFKKLRVLDLTWSDIAELPESISELVHLRYLALCCKTIKLPKCIYKLRHLEVLDMPLFHDNYPGSISKFVTLKHLETCYRHKVGEGHDWCLRTCLRVEDSFMGMD